MTSTIVITLIVYKILLIGIGFWAQRRTRDAGDYFLGGRELGPVVASISYGASSASAWTLLGMSGLAYTIGLPAVWLAAGAVVGVIVAWGWLAPRLMSHSRAHNQLTLTEFFIEDAAPAERRKISLLASGIILFCFIFYIAAQFQGAGNTFATLFAIDARESILLGGTIILLYTLLGGFWAVSVTDTLQGLLMLLAALLLPIAAWQSAGGWASIGPSLAIDSGSHWLALSGGHIGLAALGFVVGGLGVGMGTYGQPHLVSRFMALKDLRALRIGRWIAIGWFVVVFFGMCFLGWAARVLLPSVDNAEGLIFSITDQLFPSLVSGILMAAVLSAIMSTADSMLLSGAATVTHDLNIGARSGKSELWRSRLAMAVLSALAILLAVVLPSSIFDRVLFAWIAIGSAFGPALFIKLGGVSVSPTGIYRSIFMGFVLAVTLYLLPNTIGDIAERYVPFIAGVIVLLLHRRPAGH